MARAGTGMVWDGMDGTGLAQDGTGWHGMEWEARGGTGRHGMAWDGCECAGQAARAAWDTGQRRCGVVVE